MKKVFCIFFAFYFIALTAKPCADKKDCNEFKQTEMSKDDHKKQHSDELCTPFCVCSCCSTHALVKDLPSENIQIAVINTIYPAKNDFKISSAIISVWQPPKIG